MKKLFTLLLLILSINIQAQQSNKNVIISKVTADWCPNCGSWGWSFYEALKDVYSDGSAILVGVHHSGGLENPVSNWFANNLGNTYQPQFFVNNERFNVLSSNWQQKVVEIQDVVSDAKNEVAGVRIDFSNTYLEGDNIIHAKAQISSDNLETGDYYFGIYLFENDVIWYQSNQGNDAMHPFVLRDVMADNYYGEMYLPGLSAAGVTTVEKSYTIEDDSWIADNLGLLAILWKKEGSKYIVENAKAIYNVGQLSSSDELLDETIVKIYNTPGQLNIQLDDNSDYNLVLSNQQGQRVFRQVMNSAASIATDGMPVGLYILTLRSGNKIISKRIFIGR
jgi:hypothetical protein